MTDKDKEKDPKLIKAMDSIGKLFFQSLAEGRIADGTIDPTGKTKAQVLSETADWFGENYDDIKEGKMEFLFVHDLRQNWLEKAEREFKNKDYALSIILYSLYIEHWVNNLVVKSLREKDLSDTEIVTIIRETNMRGKFGWLLKILGLPPIDDDKKRHILAICEKRNSYVHYKWNIDFLGDHFENDRLILHNFKKIVPYLEEYSGDNIIKEIMDD